ncbi:hypothetical protein E8E13_000856 [Curvularia kusanoi]|uniref:Uncharacterized protein n=1 Tax=Curvularia kusanoi TaxID=90978 RepID=A0A9P4W927_CURKU|nr:hypothetical protein E8E13_000856 [Curvularia kusanoi]
MSTPPPVEGERRKSLGKYVKRMSSVFKREKSTKGVPTLSSAASAPVAPGVEQQSSSGAEAPRTATATDDVATQAIAQEPAKAEPIKQEHSTETAEASAVAAATNDLTPTTSIQQPAPVAASIPAPNQPSAIIDRNAMQRERARALFAKYGLTLEPHEFVVTSAAGPLVPRVEKPIRMRVHRSCHLCGTLYGHDKVCAQCEHRRCKHCPRYPKKKTSGEKGAAKEDPEQPKKKKLLTLTSRHGKELAYQPATQRVRRTCHKCDAFFVPPTATTCESCSHVRCTKCPREPAKRNKWPAGYPGDAAPDSEDDLDAEKKLEQFRRIWRKPRRIPVSKPRSQESFDPAVVAAVEAKLRALGVDDDSPSSDPEHL